MRGHLYKLIKKRNWNAFIERIGLFPDEAASIMAQTLPCGTRVSCVPVHIACMYEPTLQVIAALIAASSQSLEETDGIGRTALHIALRYHASPQVITMLISAAPRTVHVRAADGSLPLHVAVLYSRPIVLPVIKYLLLLHPEAAILPDGHGLLPKELVSDNLVDLPTQLEIIGILESTASRTNLFMLPDFPHDDRVHQRISHTPASSTVNRKDANSEPGYSDDNSPKIKQCVVCMDHDASRLMVPCGHAALCKRCSTEENLSKIKWQCPECRTAVREVVSFYGRILIEE